MQQEANKKKQVWLEVNNKCGRRIEDVHGIIFLSSFQQVKDFEKQTGKQIFRKTSFLKKFFLGGWSLINF